MPEGGYRWLMSLIEQQILEDHAFPDLYGHFRTPAAISSGQPTVHFSGGSDPPQHVRRSDTHGKPQRALLAQFQSRKPAEVSLRSVAGHVPLESIWLKREMIDLQLMSHNRFTILGSEGERLAITDPGKVQKPFRT